MRIPESSYKAGVLPGEHKAEIAMLKQVQRINFTWLTSALHPRWPTSAPRKNTLACYWPFQRKEKSTACFQCNNFSEACLKGLISILPQSENWSQWHSLDAWRLWRTKENTKGTKEGEKWGCVQTFGILESCLRNWYLFYLTRVADRKPAYPGCLVITENKGQLLP